MQHYKKYIDVAVMIDKNGTMTPLYIQFEDNQYAIDRVLTVRETHSIVGGCGILYQCRIQNQIRNLFYERNRWFIESHRP